MSEGQPPDIVSLMQQRLGSSAQGLKLPPPIFHELGAEVISFNAETATLVCRFPVQQRWQNPLGFMQGGMIAAVLDNTIGPLSFLVAPPSVTTHMSLTYLRPVTPQETHVVVTARLVERTRRLLVFGAQATDSAGRVLALCSATQQLLESG
ncbi:MAG: PaaI family thioesterase [Anaerolineae bacterium]|nr:PaaI family thioesterase [Anaerolineae bacterium]MDW8172237.1 PaaI family thioesterase [Anaerolineae bacterium]